MSLDLYGIFQVVIQFILNLSLPIKAELYDIKLLPPEVIKL